MITLLIALTLRSTLSLAFTVHQPLLSRRVALSTAVTCTASIAADGNSPEDKSVAEAAKVAALEMQLADAKTASEAAAPPRIVRLEVGAEEQLSGIVREELSNLAALPQAEQEEGLTTLLSRVEERAITEVSTDDGAVLGSTDEKGYTFGDVTKAVVESVRGEVQRQMDSDWNMDDLGLLLKVCVFLGVGATVPAAGLMAMPATLVLATYGTVLKAEVGVRAVQEVAVRIAERARDGIADGVSSYTRKEDYKFGDLTEETVRRMTGNDDYKFGDVTRGALKSVTGKDTYKFGDITKSLMEKFRSGKDSRDNVG